MDRLLFAGMMLLGLFVGCWGTAEALDITGTVVDETGKPVSGAKLAVLDTSFPLGRDHILLPAPPKIAVSGSFTA